MEFSKQEPDKIISEKIKVYCRLRPSISSFETKENTKDGDGFNPIESYNKDELVYQNKQDNNSNNLEFKFTELFEPTSQQEDLYTTCAQPLVESALKGYSGTIFAYGPTGSGKTFTMRGTDDNPGIIYRCMKELLDKSYGVTKILVSYIQIYCESISDLLNPENEGLAIRESSNGSIYVEGTSSILIESINDLNNLLAKGDENRTTAATLKNATSSRSHAALIIKLISNDEANEISKSDCGGGFQEGLS